MKELKRRIKKYFLVLFAMVCFWLIMVFIPPKYWLFLLSITGGVLSMTLLYDYGVKIMLTWAEIDALEENYEKDN